MRNCFAAFKKHYMKNLVVNAGRLMIHSQAGDARKCCSEIWDKPVQYKEDAEWLFKVKKELEVVKIQNKVVITKGNVIKHVLKMPD